MRTKRVDRRLLIQSAGVSALGLLMTACGQSVPREQMPTFSQTQRVITPMQLDSDSPTGDRSPVEPLGESIDTEIPGGPVGSNGRKVVKNQVFQGLSSDWADQDNTDFVDCRFIGSGTDGVLNGTIGKNIRLINPTFQDFHVPLTEESGREHLLYINMGHRELELEFVIYGGQVINCTAVEFMESKGFDPKIIGLDFTKSPGIRNGIRIRHGRGAQISNCKGLKSITLRGWQHWVSNCPQTEVTMWAGDLPARVSEWGSLHDDGASDPHKMVSSELCYAEGVRNVIAGVTSTNQLLFPALSCMVAPGQLYKTAAVKNFSVKKLRSVQELLDIA